MKNALVTMILGSVIRGLLWGAAGFLVSHNIVQPEQMDEFANQNSQIIAAVILALAGLAWSSKDKLKNLTRLKLAVNQTPPEVTMESIKRREKSLPIAAKFHLVSRDDGSPVHPG